MVNSAQLSEPVFPAGHPSVSWSPLLCLGDWTGTSLSSRVALTSEGVLKKQQEKVGRGGRAPRCLQVRVTSSIAGSKKSCSNTLVSGGTHVPVKTIWQMLTWVIFNI